MDTKRILNLIATWFLVLSMFSYVGHLMMVRFVPITENPAGYLALITPECWYWTVYSFITGIIFIYWKVIRTAKQLTK